MKYFINEWILFKGHDISTKLIGVAFWVAIINLIYNIIWFINNPI